MLTRVESYTSDINSGSSNSSGSYPKPIVLEQATLPRSANFEVVADSLLISNLSILFLCGSPSRGEYMLNHLRRKIMKFAVEGCCHGELDIIYGEIAKRNLQLDKPIELLLIGGDFEAVRNWSDLQCMAKPKKYRGELKDFYKYYTGEKTAPVLTIVIGGNHEASNYMWELHHGGWLAPNIYYLGTAGCVQVNGIRIAGVSGIFKGYDFRAGFWEKLPYDNSSMRSIYHIREYSVRTLSLLSSPDIFLSHDWPNTIEQHGDVASLVRSNKHFAADIAQRKLGSPPLMSLLHTLKPAWWFSAHMHTKFEAQVLHGPSVEAKGDNPDEVEITIDDDENNQPSANNPDEMNDENDKKKQNKTSSAQPPIRPVTNFLALDKCIPGRKYLEVLDIETPSEFSTSPPKFTFDLEWLAISKALHPYMSRTRLQLPFPPEDQAREMVAKALAELQEKFNPEGSREIGEILKFAMTAPGPSDEEKSLQRQPPPYPNPQTEAFCNFLGIPNKVDVPNRRS